VKRLKLEAEDKGVKIKIKSVVADDLQTLVYYEIEDINNNNRYMMNYHEGLVVKNEYEIMNSAGEVRFIPPTPAADLNEEEKNVYYGKLSLLPLLEDSATIDLRIISLQKLKSDPTNINGISGWSYENVEYETGEWNFEIPVSK